jgi:hypothetical protein
LLKGQESKLEETKKLILYLKKENKRSCHHIDKLLEKFATLRSDTKRHLTFNKHATNDFEGLETETIKASNKNDGLMEKLELERKENKRLCNSVKKMQDQYMTKAESRLEVQKAMAKILNMIQDECKDPQIVEDTIVIALECEAEAKSEMAALDAMDEDPGYASTDVSDSESHSDYR